MAAPLDGIRVLEVASWLAAPAATRLMADMGASVIKVEPPAGDPYRGFSLRSMGYDYDFPVNYGFEVDNLGKRSITVDLEKPDGPGLVRRLAADCDVFITNLVSRRARRYGLAYDDIRAVNPAAVYAAFSGYGTRGPEAERSGFDVAAFWAKSGLMSVSGEPTEPPALCRGGQGDHTTALNILAAVLAGLRMRDRTGEGQLVEVTLQATGIWTLATDFSGALVARQQPPRFSRTAPTHPLWNSYACADGRWILLVNPVPFPKAWPAFCEVMGRPEWATDARFASIAGLSANTAMLTAAFDDVFARFPLAHWGAELDRVGLIWAPVATLPDVMADAQVREMGWLTTVDDGEAPHETLDTPFKIWGTETGARGPAPGPGEHTFDVLTGCGLDAEEIARLAGEGVLG